MQCKGINITFGLNRAVLNTDTSGKLVFSYKFKTTK